MASEHSNNEPSTTWSKIETVLCFGIHSHAAEEAHCGDIMLAVWLAIIAAVLYEFVLIPVHAARESYVHRAPYCTALKHAWLHQCWCCAKRDPPLVDEGGYCIYWWQWRKAQRANDVRVAVRGYDVICDGPMGSATRAERSSEMGEGVFAALRDATDEEYMGNDLMRGSLNSGGFAAMAEDPLDID